MIRKSVAICRHKNWTYMAGAEIAVRAARIEL